MIAGAEILRSAVAEGLRAPRPMPVSDWAERHRKLGMDSRKPGPYRNDEMPHLVEPMNDFSDPAIREIVCMASPQTGKTTLAENCILWSMDQDPSDMIYVLSDQDTAEEWSESRLIPILRSCGPTAELISPRKWDVKKKAVLLLNGARIWITGANSPGRLSMKSTRRVFCDEVGKWPAVTRARGNTEGSALALARSRADSFGDHAKVMIYSSPNLEGVGIDAEYERTDKAERAYPCPHCGQWQKLMFGAVQAGQGDRGGVRWPGPPNDARLSELTRDQLTLYREQVRKEAWYECIHCGERITESQRPGMLRAGVWVRLGEQLKPDGTREGEAIRTSRRGYRWSWLDSMTKRWGDIAEEFVEARGVMTQDFANRVLSEPWRPSGSSTDEATLGAIVLSQIGRRQAAGTAHKRGECPEDVRLIIGSIDVQQEHVFVQIAGWGPDARRWLIDQFEVPWPRIAPHKKNEALSEDELLDTAGAVVQAVQTQVRQKSPSAPDGYRSEWVDFWAIDSRHRTSEVYALCAALGPRIYPVLGQDQQRRPIEYTTAHERLPPGRRLSRFAAAFRDRPALLLKVGYWKDDVFRRMHDDERWLWPGDIDWKYLAHLWSEQRVPVERHGIVVGYRWVPKPGKPPNHYFDCTVYEVALLHEILDGDTLDTLPLREKRIHASS